jgi:hypothetical protein
VQAARGSTHVEWSCRQRSDPIGPSVPLGGPRDERERWLHAPARLVRANRGHVVCCPPAVLLTIDVPNGSLGGLWRRTRSRTAEWRVALRSLRTSHRCLLRLAPSVAAAPRFTCKAQRRIEISLRTASAGLARLSSAMLPHAAARAACSAYIDVPVSSEFTVRVSYIGALAVKNDGAPGHTERY